MSLFPSLPEAPHLADVLKKFPHTAKPLLDYHDRLMRDASPLTIAERELIAAYVSGLNACNFCHGAHKLAAEAFGVDGDVIETLMTDLDGADIDDKVKPLLHYVKRLTQTPSQMRDRDAEAVYEAGWNEQALFDAISVCALYNFMNRIVEGTGVAVNHDVLAERRKTEVEARGADDLADAAKKHEGSGHYTEWGKSMGII